MRHIFGLLYFVLLQFSLAAHLANQELLATDDDLFANGVRTTDPQTPTDELASFSVPPGFAVQLVAAEPTIAKPMNMAFDVRGRLWVTDTLEYPYAAPPDRPGRDSVKILEDADGDGFAEKVTTFADGLNIPIGIYPFQNGAIVYSIPYIWNLQDTDGDGVCDQRTRLYGPFGYERDTHGMNNSFRRGFDGWLYACHGFNNQTQVAGADGHSISMQSGNTYRMRTDGERLEHFTWGQVNPFGMSCDEFGNLFTADCHSKPLYQLLRDGYYPSFGKPDDGLGFVAEMMDHLHGSTAIAGAAVTTGKMFPAEYTDNIFSGNVMTSRVNRNRLERNGATYRAIEQPDLLSTTDPWFRPVDVQFGPDGALYVADFYNRIIGHYEVPLTHPGRDRTSGRIWRIIYRGTDGRQDTPVASPTRAALPQDLNISQADSPSLAQQLVDALDHPVLPQRMKIADHIVDRLGEIAIPAVRAKFHNTAAPAAQRVQCLWILQRLQQLTPDERATAARDSDLLLRIHATKSLGELPQLSAADSELLQGQLNDADALVRKAAAEAAARHDAPILVQPLLNALTKTSASDPILRQAFRIAIRNQLRTPDSWAQAITHSLPVDEQAELVDICLALPHSAAGNFLADALAQKRTRPDKQSLYLRHAVRTTAPQQIDPLVAVIRQEIGSDLSAQFQLLESLDRSGNGSTTGDRVSTAPAIRAWAAELANRFLAPNDAAASRPLDWHHELHADGPNADQNPWQVQRRNSADGQDALFLSSLPTGEQQTSRLLSEPFAAPAKLQFYLAGHDGYPDQELQHRNAVRLLDAATVSVVRTANAPRNDMAQLVQWDLSDLQGRNVIFEVVDGDSSNAYAWLAIGRFSYEPLNPSTNSQAIRQASSLVRRFHLSECAAPLRAIATSAHVDRASQAAAMDGLLAIQPDVRLQAILAAWQGRWPSADVWQQLTQTVAARTADATEEQQLIIDQQLWQTMKLTPTAGQRRSATVLASDRVGIERLVRLVEAGLVPGTLLKQADVQPKWQAVASREMKLRIEQLLVALPEPSVDRENLIQDRLSRFAIGGGASDRGAELFKKNCTGCHQVAGQGALVGPQLDGIRQRGVARLLEDILDPHRNVDVAFRVTTFVLQDGRVLTGLKRSESADEVVIADPLGKEMRLPTADIEQRRESMQSLMPDNFGEVLTAEQFNDIATFLMNPAEAAH